MVEKLGVSTQRKPPPNTKSLAIFSHTPEGIRMQTGERQLAVGGNALDHTAIRPNLSLISPCI